MDRAKPWADALTALARRAKRLNRPGLMETFWLMFSCRVGLRFVTVVVFELGRCEVVEFSRELQARRLHSLVIELAEGVP